MLDNKYKIIKIFQNGIIMKWGIWVKMIKHKVDGWMIENKGIALFESKKEADYFIRQNTVHKEYYESRKLTKKDIKYP